MRTLPWELRLLKFFIIIIIISKRHACTLGVITTLTSDSMLQLVPGGRAIASGNWGCGAFCGDPCLKMALQWVAASLARAPRLLYFTFGEPRLQQVCAL